MKTKLINVTLPTKLLNEVDQLAGQEALSRAELLRAALRDYLQSFSLRKQSFDLLRTAAQRNDLSEKEARRLIDRVRAQLPSNR